MCGIAGYLCLDPARPAPQGLVAAMARALAHRGPDHQGSWADGPISLGHARLAIIDLRPEANQPMLSEDSAAAVVLNGEIYNFQQLGAELQRSGVPLRTRSDTEVLLKLYLQRGVDCLRELRGMFAFAIWDGRHRRLLLVRDRVGKKPIYYFCGPRGLSFASEMGALLLDPDLQPRVDCSALRHYLALGYVPSSQAAFAGVAKVPPGSYALWERGELRVERYWKLVFGPIDRRSEGELVEDLRARLADAVAARMISDVPLGAFLSGGIDSSAVVAMMAARSSQRVKTFSIGFEDEDLSELKYAREVARRFDTEHHEEIVRPDTAALLPELVERYGEPFADPSAIPTYCLARMTRRYVTVALSGDGGDEAFAGYTRYAYERAARLYARLPLAVVQPVARALTRLPGRGRGRLAELLALVRDRARRIQLPALRRYSAEFGHFDAELLGRLCVPELVTAAEDAEALFAELLRTSSAVHPVDRLLDLDVNTYLPDDIFVKVDIASMAHALEVRAPLVDHQLLEFAARLPASSKLRLFRGKRILREAVAQKLPSAILQRRKRGFGIPHARWLRGDLHGLTHDLLRSPRARGRGYFEPRALDLLLEEHDSGRVDHGLRIWSLLWLELWHRRFIDVGAGATAVARSVEAGQAR